MAISEERYDREKACQECGQIAPLEILLSPGNHQYYLGHECPCCGPLSRETHYIATRKDAVRIYRRAIKGDKETWVVWGRQWQKYNGVGGFSSES